MAKKKAKAAKKKANRLKELYGALEAQLKAQLEVRRLAHRNAEAKGEACEEVWIDLLAKHLPFRYQVGKGIVVDSQGRESEFIDVIIYDRQYTPLVFSEEGRTYFPAESVYAVVEAKQTLTRNHIIYAGKKALSVRRLFRTNAPTYQAGDVVKEAGQLKPILAGIVTYKSSWNPPFGNPLKKALGELTKNQQLDFGMAAEHGYFEVAYEVAGPKLTAFKPKLALAAFMMALLTQLQKKGTVPAIEYAEYVKSLKA